MARFLEGSAEENARHIWTRVRLNIVKLIELRIVLPSMPPGSGLRGQQRRLNLVVADFTTRDNWFVCRVGCLPA